MVDEKRVLVAGATGYLGGFVAKEFKSRGHYVRALARSPHKLDHMKEEIDEIVKSEITDPISIKGICEGIDLVFEKSEVGEIAKIAFEVNSKTENIGARRLQTVMTKLLENILYEAPDFPKKKIRINRKYGREILDGIVKDKDLSRYIL